MIPAAVEADELVPQTGVVWPALVLNQPLAESGEIDDDEHPLLRGFSEEVIEVCPDCIVPPVLRAVEPVGGAERVDAGELSELNDEVDVPRKFRIGPRSASQ